MVQLYLETIAPVHRRITMGYYGYVYLTENCVTGKKYIGQHHWEHPGIDPKYYGSGKLLTRAIKKHGKENFRVYILQWCKTKWDLDAREMAWIRFYDAVNSPEFYNITQGGEGFGSGELNPNYGIRLSEETRRKISENHADQSGENNPRYGYRYTEEDKLKMSIAHSKLTESQILEIVELNKQGFLQKEIAKRFDVSTATISKICSGKTFSFITGIGQ